MLVNLCNKATLYTEAEMECRAGCGACCIAPSISSPIPGMLEGKPAGGRCVQLNDEYRCQLFGSDERPKVCRDFEASKDVCGSTRDVAMVLIESLEKATN